MNIGYTRVSTDDQTLNLELEALKAAGCKKLFTKIANGASTDRPVLLDAIAYARAGDILVVWRLDRLGRSLQHLIATVAELSSALASPSYGRVNVR